MKLAEVDAKCTVVQQMVFEKAMNGRQPNSFTAEKENWRVVTEKGRLVLNDVRYAETYPNSFLDIWYPDEDQTKKRPVVINFHGGGFIFGSKKMGDPLAVSSSDGDAYVDRFLDLGYIFVNADYALAPMYRFPVQIKQADEVVRFVLAHAEEYGFDTTNLTMTGGSAGADITEIYAMAISDPDYAKALGFTPILGADGLKCVIINESALQMDVNEKDNNMCALLQCWIGEDDPVNSEPSKLADVSKHIKGVYPPAFLIASNNSPFFTAEVREMDKALTQYNLPHAFFDVPQSIAVLDHGFVNQFDQNPVAKDCMEQMLAFLTQYTK